MPYFDGAGGGSDVLRRRAGIVTPAALPASKLHRSQAAEKLLGQRQCGQWQLSR